MDAYPGQVFHGKLAREASSITPDIRSEMDELDLDNPGDRVEDRGPVNPEDTLLAQGSDQIHEGQLLR